MVIDMNDERLVTLAQVRQFIEGTAEVEFRRCGKDEDRYRHIEGVLRRFRYGRLKRAEKGLVVPVIRDCDTKSFAEIEQAILDAAKKARDGKLLVEDLQGGVFTISNGGIYGSLLSTPILNPPQSGILGMHTIQDRPVALQGQVVIRPMMYLALSYDHRVVDGKEAVTFLIRIKDCLENPARLLLGA